MDGFRENRSPGLFRIEWLSLNHAGTVYFQGLACLPSFDSTTHSVAEEIPVLKYGRVEDEANIAAQTHVIPRHASAEARLRSKGLGGAWERPGPITLH